jgi:hypothetical protein
VITSAAEILNDPQPAADLLRVKNNTAAPEASGLFCLPIQLFEPLSGSTMVRLAPGLDAGEKYAALECHALFFWVRVCNSQTQQQHFVSAGTLPVGGDYTSN